MKKFTFLIVFIVIAAGLFAQNGTRLIGYDAVSMGRAGTTIGTFDSPELMMTNPAGLSFLNSSALNLDISLMAPSTYFKNTLNDKNGDKNLFPLPSAGYVNKSKKNDAPFTWGIGFFTQGGMGADFSLKNELYRTQTYAVNGGKYYPVKGDYIEQTYHSKFAVMQGGPSVAYKFNEQFSAGISAHFVYSMMEFSMPFGLNPSVMQGSPNNMPTATFGQLFSMSPSLGGFGYSEVIASADMSKLNVVSWGGKIGLAWKPNQTVSFGLNYTLPTTLTYKNGKATMDMSKQFEDAMGRAVVGFYSQPGTTGAPLDTAFKYIGINFAQMGIDLTQGVAAQYDLEVGMKLPQSIGLGMSYNASKVVRLSFDAEWVNWKSAFDKMEIRMTNGTSANINKMIGSTNFNYDFPLNWKDAFIVKVGGEYDVAKEVTLRLGYAYGSNPVPESTVFPVFPAIVENHLTFGGSYKFNTRMSLNLAFETALDKQLVAANPSLIQSEFSGSTSGLSTVLGHLSFNLNF